MLRKIHIKFLYYCYYYYCLCLKSVEKVFDQSRQHRGDDHINSSVSYILTSRLNKELR